MKLNLVLSSILLVSSLSAKAHNIEVDQSCLDQVSAAAANKVIEILNTDQDNFYNKVSVAKIVHSATIVDGSVISADEYQVTVTTVGFNKVTQQPSVMPSFLVVVDEDANSVSCDKVQTRVISIKKL